MSRDVPDETRITGKIEQQRGTTYITEQGSYLKRTPQSFSVYDQDPRGPHDSIHFDKKSDGSIKVTETKDGKRTDSSCYLTTACLRVLMDEFNDDCYELTTLRWFRDRYVATNDIAMYYEIAPLVVMGIEALPAEQQKTIYTQIYEHVVRACIQFIERGDYDSAYKRYKDSILMLQNQFALSRPGR